MARPLDCVVASALRVLDSDSDAMECLEAGTSTESGRALAILGKRV